MTSTGRVLGHSLLRSLISSHRLIFRLHRTVCFARALRCAHSLARSLTPSFQSSQESDLCLWNECVDFIVFAPTLHPSAWSSIPTTCGIWLRAWACFSSPSESSSSPLLAFFVEEKSRNADPISIDFAMYSHSQFCAIWETAFFSFPVVFDDFFIFLRLHVQFCISCTSTRNVCAPYLIAQSMCVS